MYRTSKVVGSWQLAAWTAKDLPAGMFGNVAFAHFTSLFLPLFVCPLFSRCYRTVMAAVASAAWCVIRWAGCPVLVLWVGMLPTGRVPPAQIRGDLLYYNLFSLSGSLGGSLWYLRSRPRRFCLAANQGD
ncbi:hypothetical protein IF1G_00104 [Cordyceps javanica]|uniref:Uncharacterized protein n=1 Tax=Cordyceps javanica TaxID=43265 RepID=A0A545VEM2_9HYPO|nr:hypothetical protein IF1G_00104 [Cordyceps javanica]